MTRVFVRHAPVLVTGVCYGQADVPTAPLCDMRGAIEACCTSVRRRLGAPTAIVSSPSGRCAELARRLASEFMPYDAPRYDYRLRELNMGEWEGRSWTDIETVDGARLAAWMRNWDTEPPPGGETPLELVERVQSCLAEQRQGERWLIVTHAGVIRAHWVATGICDWPEAMNRPIGYLGVEPAWARAAPMPEPSPLGRQSRKCATLERPPRMSEHQCPQPFVKWVGGKRALMGELRARVPSTFGAYFEPFVGGGALFFELASEIAHATLVDSNLELALTYQVIRKDPDTLIERLRREAARHSPEHYYRVRARSPRDPVGTAARFLYLNKTCFNGLYRVNKSGKFNAPLGRYANPTIVAEDNLRACSRALRAATVLHGDFEAIRPLVQRGDFVYFDPPYHPTSDDSFTAYTANNFTEKDQVRLRDFVLELGRQGVQVMLSNSRTRLIEDLYRRASFTKHIVRAPRSVNCKPTARGRVEELLITNYKI